LLYSFDRFVLDTNTRELRRDRELLSVEPKVFDLLSYLIVNRERVVSKDDLIASVWNGRVVSESALTTCINGARVALGDSGDAQQLIRTIPRKGLRFVGNVREAAPPSALPDYHAMAQAAKHSDRPSVAVLPFTDTSDPSQAYFADGIVDEITIALTRMRWLTVIARNSSFTYRDKAVDVRQVGQELRVRYVIEGSVRKHSERVRITAQLIDTETRATLAAHRFESELGDIFALQDKVASEVVATIAPKLEANEIVRAQRKPTENLDAYDLYLRGLERFYNLSHSSHEQALAFFRQAIELDPNFASAYGMAARCYITRKMNGWSDSSEPSEAIRLARYAARLGMDDAVALSSAGITMAYVAREVEAGAALIDTALSLNPNLAIAWAYSGYIEVYRENSAGAIDRFSEATRLNPLDPLIFSVYVGIAAAHFVAGRFQAAWQWAEKALAVAPRYIPALRIAAASYALDGHLREAAERLALIRQIYPKLAIPDLRDQVPFAEKTFNQFVLGLQKAGLPDRALPSKNS
jgi:TolB-like protein